ncbi:hypothetical protein AKJ16_DCAP06714 [Drosera capensis]
MHEIYSMRMNLGQRTPEALSKGRRQYSPGRRRPC